jgi:hypothetical protein
MPILPAQNQSPYDNLNTILLAAQARLNDSIDTTAIIGGRILDSTTAFSQTVVNTAWRKFQSHLANLGYTRLQKEVILTGLQPVASQDPASQCRLDWNGFFDGQNYWQTPALPSDFMAPLVAWERQSGQNALFVKMECILERIPGYAKTVWNGCWQWREDAVFLPGSLMPMDLQFKYISLLSDFQDISTSRWYDVTVPIVFARDSLAWFICAEFVGTRGDMTTAELFLANAEKAAGFIMNRDIKMKQRVNVRRQPRSFANGARGGNDMYV